MIPTQNNICNVTPKEDLKVYFSKAFIARNILKVALPIIATAGAVLACVLFPVLSLPIIFKASLLAVAAGIVGNLLYSAIRVGTKVKSILSEKQKDSLQDQIETEIKEKQSFRDEMGEIIREAMEKHQLIRDFTKS